MENIPKEEVGTILNVGDSSHVDSEALDECWLSASDVWVNGVNKLVSGSLLRQIF